MSVVMARGVLYVHSAPTALCPHVEWAIGSVLDKRIDMEWTAQPAAPGLLRAELSWVGDSRSRVRDQGHVFHVEAFVRPLSGRTPTLEQLEAAADVLRELDWKVHDVAVVPVRDLPETIPDPG